MQPNFVHPSQGGPMHERPADHMVSHQPFATFSPTPPSGMAPPSGMPPTPPGSMTIADATRSDLPVPVVQALSVRGVEYTMMTLALWFAAGALLWVLLSVINGDSSFDLLAVPSAVLIVAVPIFGFLFLRLRREELANTELRLDASKRRLSQFTQILTFATCFFNLIAFVFEIMEKLAGRSTGSIGKVLLDLLIVFIVSGGIFRYYWVDEHRLIRNR